MKNKLCEKAYVFLLSFALFGCAGDGGQTDKSSSLSLSTSSPVSTSSGNASSSSNSGSVIDNSCTEAVSDGSAVWRDNCSGCHGDTPPDGQTRWTAQGRTIDLYDTAQDGYTDTNNEMYSLGMSAFIDATMPPFGGGSTVKQANDVTAYMTFSVNTNRGWCPGDTWPPEQNKRLTNALPPSSSSSSPVVDVSPRAVELYNQQCKSCHGADGNGNVWKINSANMPYANPLGETGPAALQTLLAAYIESGMPKENEADCSGECAQLTAAYILKLPPLSAPENDWDVHQKGAPAQLRRLSSRQLANSLKAITGIDANFDQLPLEKRNANTMYRPTGDAFTAQEIAKLEAYINEYTAAVSGGVLTASSCKTTGQAQNNCLSTWGKALVSRAFSRPLETSENTAIDKLMSDAGGSTQEQASIVKDLLYGTFMSPSFLYGVELGERDAVGGEQRELSGREIAERLSIAILGRMPDDTLLANAEQLKDSSFRLSMFDRLWNTDEARNSIGEFVLDWLGAAESDIQNKAELYLEGLPDQFATDIRKSAINSVAIVLQSENPTLNGLLTTKAYLADEAVQLITAEKLVGTSITGIGSDQCNNTTQCKTTFGDTADDCSMSASNMSVCMCGGQKCDALFSINNDNDALRFGDNRQSNRQGLMMHPYVLSSLTKQTGASPFQIGINYKKTMLCDYVPEPPVGAEEKALKLAPAGSSAIEELKYKTNAGAVCLGCHLQFNDLGFAFMPFDPLGRWEQEDPKLMTAWADLDGIIPTFRGKKINFYSPSDLSIRFSQDPQVLGCFAQASMEWVLGRELIPQEKNRVEAINNIAQATNGKIYDIFKAIVASPEFTRVFTSEAN